ncbi:thiazole biosynthesis protein ThiJ (plasmid) [Methylosinus sp. C49]|uniref:DJ-1/PfpI family protein n=1 Tax=Methylosinus sp. C49 TaxID=2699395 RepID=UPI001366BD9C|nr:DJ-1/PfpI family protein [Methylosinus sp. C49]BBU64304.1 thiazole biosynthesis protein ThiJ [Methylosinus sp. C49]
MDTLDRRRFGEALVAFAALVAGGALDARAAQKVTADHDMSNMPASWSGNEKIGFLIYPEFTALDMIGPHYMLTGLMGATAFVIAKSKTPVVSDTGLTLTPDASFDDAPVDLDILCVPGGASGTLAAMQDEATLRFIKSRGARAKYVTSVCTGSLLLGAAGLLDGYRATSHWSTKPLLPIFGATPTSGRFVRDRNRITAEGVTAGLDFALALVGELRDRTYAEGVQLIAQYAPEPPFDAGQPERAPAAVRTMMEEMFAGFRASADRFGREAFVKSKAF